MSIASFELRKIEWRPAKAAVVVAALLSAGIHLAIATTAGDNAFAVLGLGILLGFVVFFTELWAPVHYLAGALYVGLTAVVWLLAGRPQPVLGVVDKVIQVVLVVTLVYLLVVETRRGEEPGAD